MTKHKTPGANPTTLPDYDHIVAMPVTLYCDPIDPRSWDLPDWRLLILEKDSAPHGGGIFIESASYTYNDKVTVDMILDIGLYTEDIDEFIATKNDPSSVIVDAVFRALADFDRLFGSEYYDRVRDFSCIDLDTIFDIHDAINTILEELRSEPFKPFQNLFIAFYL